MSVFTYTARRNLIAGHTAETSYSLETSAQASNPTLKNIGPRVVAMGGQTSGLLHRIEEGRQVKTGFIQDADLPAWREFLDSVAAAEIFNFDEYGTIASPDNPRQAIVEGSPTIARVGAIRIWEITITLRFV